MNARTVTLTARLTETDQPLAGSRAWVAEQIESSVVSVGNSKAGNPVVWLRNGNKSESLAWFASPFGYGEPQFDIWPGVEFGINRGETESLFGVPLTESGQKLLTDFARKCRTLLRSRMRRSDKSSGSRLRVKLTDAD